MNAILLVGGLGTRLRPLTLTQPKALLPVHNRPFLSYQLDLLRAAGVKSVILASGGIIRRWEKDIRKLGSKGMKLHFAYEPSPMGTGGAIRFAYDTLKKRNTLTAGPVLVFNGDVFLEFDMRSFVAFHRKRGSQATVLLNRVDDPSRFGVVSLSKEGRIHQFVEKPKSRIYGNLINAGAYILESNWIENIPAGRVISVERESFPSALKKNTPMFGFPMKGYWNDIGTPQTYLQAQQDLFDKKLFRKRGRFLLGSSTRVAKTVRLEGFVCCGDKVLVDQDVVLKNCVIMNGAKIGKGVSIEGSVIGRECVIKEFSKIGEGTMLGDKTVLPPYTRC